MLTEAVSSCSKIFQLHYQLAFAFLLNRSILDRWSLLTLFLPSLGKLNVLSSEK